MERLLLLANPSASGFTGAALRQVTTALRHDFDVHQEWPVDAKGTREAASAAAASGYELVAVMGGDGVVHHAANGLVGTDTALAVIPAGTTNVFARILHIPYSSRKAAEQLAGFARTPIPVADISYDGPAAGSCVAVFSVGTGYDGAVIGRAEKTPWSKLHFGSLHYARSAFAELARYRTQPATIRVVAGARAADAVAVSVQIQSRYTYFGPLSFGFGDHPGLAVMVAERLPVSRFLGTMVRLAAGRSPASSAPLHLWLGVAEVEIAAEPAVPLQIDGEPIGVVDHVSVATAARSLLVCAPQPK